MDFFLIALVLVIAAILLWAVFGGREESIVAPSAPAGRKEEEPAAAATEEPERVFRRRAVDREIEQESDAEQGPRRRKSDQVTDLNEAMSDDFKLPYSSDQIISDTSRFRIYKRTLQNAEIYASKGDYATSISLFEGVSSRINDEKTLQMLDSNVGYLKDYSQRKEKSAEDSAAESAIKGLSRSGGLRFTIDGPIPDSINIGVIDPNRNLDPEKIADRVAGEIRGELTELRQTVQAIREAGAAVQAGRSVDSLQGEISDLRSRLNEMRRDREREMRPGEPAEVENLIDELADLRRDAGEVAALRDELREIQRLRRQLDSSVPPAPGQADIESLKEDVAGMADLRKEINDLGRRLNGLTETALRGMQPPPGTVPLVVETRQSGPLPVTIDPKPIIDIINALPKTIAPAMQGLASIAQTAAAMPKFSPADIQAQPSGPAAASPAPVEYMAAPVSLPQEKLTEKEKIREGEEEDSFELISEYGRDRTGDNLSDADIFEKILKEDPAAADENQFEIIGEKHERADGEMNIIDGDYAKRQRDNEAFYRHLLSTDKRKKKELPILKVSYDFTKLPDDFSLSREKNILEYSFYKYKPMLEKAAEFIKTRKVRDAINYYKVILGQNIPPEFKSMIRRNINDLTEYLEKYLTSD